MWIFICEKYEFIIRNIKGIKFIFYTLIYHKSTNVTTQNKPRANIITT